MGKMVLDDFIRYAKEQFDCEISVKKCDKPDTFDSIFGASFLTNMDEYSLMELVEELSKQAGFDSNRIWIGRNSYDEYEMEIDGELWSNSYTYDETETAIRCLFKGMELNKS